MYATARKHGHNMIDPSVLAEIVKDKTAGKGVKKNYIPFTRAEFNKLRSQFNKPEWMPADFKLLLQAIGEKRLGLVSLKSKSEESEESESEESESEAA
jgi:hypothetical protein